MPLNTEVYYENSNNKDLIDQKKKAKIGHGTNSYYSRVSSKIKIVHYYNIETTAFKKLKTLHF